VEDLFDVADLSGYKVKMGVGIDHIDTDAGESVGVESGMYKIRLRDTIAVERLSFEVLFERFGVDWIARDI
jgi:hypothetical protein